ncbi:MAG TPA: hypothetical protein VHF67_09465 [Gaiellaceae bacterium]|jgi:hypothetical protein|nr:hypothetical protein [Gaiellaceae bacterium]
MLARVISTRVHGIVDYVTGATLVAAPELFRLKGVPRSARVPRLLGTGATGYSLLTDYELGAVRLLPMRAHLALDAAGGALLALSPWLLGTARRGRRHWLPHALVGAGEIAFALVTKSEPEGEAGGDEAFASSGVAASGPTTPSSEERA